MFIMIKTINVKLLSYLNKKDFSQLFDDCTEEYGSYVSEKMSIGAYIPEDSVDTVLVARKGYYHNA